MEKIVLLKIYLLSIEDQGNVRKDKQWSELAVLIQKSIAYASEQNEKPLDIRAMIKSSEIIERLTSAFVKEQSLIKSIEFSSETFFIDALDGKNFITKEKDLFCGDVVQYFDLWGLNEEGFSTEKSEIKICRLISDSLLSKIFYDISEELDDIVVTQAQIVKTFKKYPELINKKEKASFLFLIKHDDYYVVEIFSNHGLLSPYVYRFGYKHVMERESNYYIMYPKN